MAMKPSAANRSATARNPVCQPVDLLDDDHHGAFSLRSGKAMKAATLDSLPWTAMSTHSWWRGERSRAALAAASPGGIGPLSARDVQDRWRLPAQRCKA